MMFAAILRKLCSVIGWILILTACRSSDTTTTPTAALLPPTLIPEPSPEPNTAAGFDTFLGQAEALKPNQRQELVNRYMALLETTPIVSGSQALFLWRGEGQSVLLLGDMNNWSQKESTPLTRLEGTDLWYLAAEYEGDARLDYKFLIDNQDWRLDPLNPRTIMSDLGPNSELVMPDYKVAAELYPSESDIPTGSLTSHTIDSLFLNQTRTFLVYAPAGQLIGKRLPSVYIHDGDEYLSLAGATTILDRLIARRDIPPLVAVFIPPINRNTEYNHNDGYVNFLAEELVPFIQETYATDPDPAATGTLGASMGGLAAVYASLTRPDVFGRAAAQSGAFSIGEDALRAIVIKEQGALESGGIVSRLPRMYIVIGAYETAVGGNVELGNLLAANRRLIRLLQSNGYEISFEERPEGHSWGLWRGTLGQALGFLFN